MKIIKNIIVIFWVCALFFSALPTLTLASELSLNLNESVDVIVNPDCGFYKAVSGNLLRQSDFPVISEETIQKYASDFGLLHLRIGLEDFSKKAGGADVDITSGAISSLTSTLNYLRKHKISAIIRFSYNVNGDEDSNGYLENEPSLTLIKKHISSLGKIINEFSDVILSVDSGMFGPWGEQHSTAISNDENANNYYQLIDAWLNALCGEISVTARRPLYLMHYLNVKHGLRLTAKNIGSFDVTAYEECARLGVYNDGYLGSSSDWGTFSNRSNETAFIGKLSNNVLYGGEVIEDSKTGGIGSYNAVNYLEKEGFITHTSYLNLDWNYEKVISVWQSNTYSGEDELYKDAKTSEFTFVNNRLGYRLVVTNFNLEQKSFASGSTLDFSVTVENKGFAKMIRKPNVNLILAGINGEYILPCELDLTCVESKNSKKFDLSLQLPKNLKGGDYTVYLQVETPYGRKIYFANGSNYYKNQYGALPLETKTFSSTIVRDKFLVTFDANYGRVVSGSTSQLVKIGESAVAPEVERNGYDFVGWNVDFSCVTQDLNVVAIWEKTEENSSEQDSSNSQNSSLNQNSEVCQNSASEEMPNKNNGGCGANLIFNLNLSVLAIVVATKIFKIK